MTAWINITSRSRGKAKRFLAFGYDSYYPAGAESDYVGSFDTFNSAMGEVFDCKPDIVDIFDIETGKWQSWYLSDDKLKYIPADLSYEPS